MSEHFKPKFTSTQKPETEQISLLNPEITSMQRASKDKWQDRMNPQWVKAAEEFNNYIEEKGVGALVMVDTSKMSEEEVRASADSYCLWSTNGNVDCSQCESLKTPCDACLFLLPRLTRVQLLERCMRQSNMHFMDDKDVECLLCLDPKNSVCRGNIWSSQGYLNCYKDGLIMLEDKIERRREELASASAASPEFHDIYEKRWSELMELREHAEDRGNKTFPDAVPASESFDEMTLSTVPTHKLNKEMTECVICGTRSLENQMCYGAPTITEPEYIDISGDCSPPVYTDISNNIVVSGEVTDPPGEERPVKAEEEVIAVETEREGPMIDCWCKYEDPYAECERLYPNCLGNEPGSVATSADGWLQRREDPKRMEVAECPSPESHHKRELRQRDIREFATIDNVIGGALVSEAGDGGDNKHVHERSPRDITLAPRDQRSADREVWLVRAKKQVVMRSGESRRVRSNIILPPPPHPYVSKIVSPEPHWLAEHQMLKVKQGVLNMRRGGALNVNLHNPSPNTVYLQIGSVIGQLIREPFLEM